MAFWFTPTMTGAHLLFAIMTTAYMLAAIRWEEHDLVVLFGEKYARYRESVPMLVPVGSSKPRESTDVDQPAAKEAA